MRQHLVWLLMTAGVLVIGTGEGQEYRVTEVQFASSDVVLAGTLTIPDQGRNLPGLVLLSGSGPQDRDGANPSVPGYEPFAEIADFLSSRGFAVLRYDERGVGESGGEHAPATSFDLATDAEVALEFMRSRERVNAERVGYLGHSEGAWLAALIAARNPHVDFVVALAGHAVPGAELLPVQAERDLRARGVPESQMNEILADQQAEIELIVREDWEALERRIYEQVMEAFERMPEEQRSGVGDLEAAAKARVGRSMVALRGWLYTFLTADPTDAWERVEVPVLAVFGGLDTQVDVEQNRPELEAALERAGNENVTIRVVDDANHLFQMAETAADEYSALAPDLSSELLETITAWLVDHAGT